MIKNHESRRSVRYGLAGLLGLIFLATTAAVFAGDEIPTFEENWFVVTMQGQQCGYRQSITRRVGNEIHSRAMMNISMARGDATITIATDQNYRETLEGKPLGFVHTMTMGQMPTQQIGTVDGDKIVLVNEQSGVKQTNTYPFDPEVRFPWGQTLEQRKRGIKPGTKYTVKTYEPSMKTDGPIEVAFEVHGKETVDVLGKTRKLHRVTATMQMMMPVATESWVDDDANPVITVVDMGLMKIKIFLATKEEALRDAKPAEMFVSTFVKVDGVVDGGANKVKLRLRLPSDSKMKMPVLPSTAMQQVRRVNDHETIVTINRLDWDRIRKVAKDASTVGELKDYLGRSTMCDTKDRRIRRLARKGAKGCVTPAEKADALRRFVTQYVKEKNLSVCFATASEVAKTKEGDCSEHAVLLAALARVAGLPARGVSGLVKVPGYADKGEKSCLFGYHMWTQVNIGGKWVDIDAAMRQTEVDVTHIALAVMPLNEEGLMESAIVLLPLLGQLEIDVLEGTP